MWMRTRDWIKSGGAIPDILDLKNDLVSPTYKVPSTGIVELEPKDKIKERLGRSPDIADALALTFAYFIGRKQRDALGRPRATMAETEYDPLA